MIQKFLQAKHWQLFTLTYGLPFLFQIILISSMLNETSGSRGGNISPVIELYFKIVPFISVIFITIFMGWFYSIGVALQKKIPENLRQSIRFFKLTIIFPLIYFIAVFAFLFSGMAVAFLSSVITGLVIILPLHLFAMFCMGYNLYFTSKTIKTAELQRETSFGDYAGEFFLIWFFPIGIWFIQPKINELVRQVPIGFAEEELV